MGEGIFIEDGVLEVPYVNSRTKFTIHDRVNDYYQKAQNDNSAFFIASFL